jgi:hypothetical protein
MRAIVTALRNSHRVVDEDTGLAGLDGALNEEQIPPTWDDRMEYPADRLRVFSVSRRATRPGKPESGVRECEFFLATPDPDEPPMLMQRIDPTRNEQPDGGGVLLSIAHNVMGLDFSYHDGEEWVDEWDGERAKFPLAVRIRLIVSADADGRDPWPISRIVNLPYPIVEDQQSSGGDG